MLLESLLFSKTRFNSCKMERFIYKSGCGIRVSRYLKEELALVIDKQFQCTIFYYTIPLKTVNKDN